MKYLVRLDEVFEEKYSRSQAKLNKPKINRAELLAQIEAAEAEDDWAQVAELLELLKGINESIMLDWQGHTLLLENVQEGKALVQKMANAEFTQEKARLRREGDTGDDALPGDEVADERLKEKEESLKKRIDQKYLGPNSDFEKIKQLLNFSGPIAAFTRFRYLQGATMDILTNLQRTLVDLRDYIGQLPMTIDEYSKLDYSPEAHMPGYEALGDELNKLLELRGGNWLISKLPKDAMRKLKESGRWAGPIMNHREDFKKAPREKQIELQKAASDLNALNKPALLRLVLGQIPGKPSLDAILDVVNNTIKNAETDRGKLIELAMDAYPSVAVLYAEGDHFVFSFRNDSQIPFLCAKVTSWCIQPSWYNKGYADQFWNYATGSLQLGIIDFTVDSSNPYHTVGVTISPNKSVKSLCNQPNHCTNGSDYRTMFARFDCGEGSHSYPKEMIDEIDSNFDRELSLKLQSDSIYKTIKEYSKGEREYEQAITKTLVGMVNDLSTLTSRENVTEDDLKASSEKNIVNQIVATEIKNMRGSSAMTKVQKDFVQKYGGGSHVFPSPADIKIFEIVLEDSPLLTDSLIDRMIQTHTAVSQKMGSMLSTLSNTETATSKKIKMYHTSLKDVVIALESLREKIKK